MEHIDDKTSAEKPAENGRDPFQQSDGAPEGGSEKSKIFVKSDESWKAEVQKEKERLQKKADVEKEFRERPPPSFMNFVGDLGVQAMLALGLMEIKGEGGPKRDLPAARYTIDLLGVLQEKTRGNLSSDEKQHLSELLQNLRLSYVKIAQAVAEDEKKIQDPGKKIIT